MRGSFLRSKAARRKCGAGRWKRGHSSYLKCALSATRKGKHHYGRHRKHRRRSYGRHHRRHHRRKHY